MTGKPSEPLATLTALQLADTGFPTGAFGFSWGLESAMRLGMVSRDSFGTWLATELLDRWAGFDRLIIARTWRAPLEDFATVEAGIDPCFWSEPLRAQSLRAGHAFLAGTARFGDPVAAHLQTACRSGMALGHVSALQGAVYASQGVPLDLALLAAAHSTASGLVSAGVRLGMISAVEGQRAYAAVLPELALAAVPPDRDSLPAAFAPLSEIAMLNPPSAPLFVN